MTNYSIKFVYGRKDSHTHTHMHTHTPTHVHSLTHVHTPTHTHALTHTYIQPGLLFCTLFSFYEENLYKYSIIFLRYGELKGALLFLQVWCFLTKCERKESVGLLHCILILGKPEMTCYGDIAVQYIVILRRYCDIQLIL